MRSSLLCLSGLALLVLSACGGGGGGGGASSPKPATSLVFTPASSPSGYYLAQDPGSTGTTLILDLYSPAGTTTQGVAFFLTADTTMVDWVNAGGPAGTHSLPLGAFDLGTAPQVYADKVTGGELQVGLFQKTGPATLTGTTPIVSVALALRAGAAPGPVSLAATSGVQAIVLNPDGTTSTIPAIETGTIQAE